MKTVGFVGPSGTGKSYRAQWVAKQRGIRFIIDDGLLISGSKIIAGVSAKKEPTKLASVRRALFMDEAHAQVVKRALDAYAPAELMILGTSVKMVQTITKALGLPEIGEFIYIQDVASPEEIARARDIRLREGKHVIPVPTFELKKDFSGYFLDSVKGFFFGKSKEDVTERSVVRPTFNYLGDFTIADRVLTTLAEHEAAKVPDICRVFRAAAENGPEGVDITIDVGILYGADLRACSRSAQALVSSAVEQFTGIAVHSVKIFVKSLIFEKNT